MVGNLTDDITKHHETIQNLKYRYQVCQTRVSLVSQIFKNYTWYMS
jgi:hypothetical protein